jgi:Xaa-Pro aminopeptidase
VGAVISNEPGLYFAKYGIGIRIEDDLLLTKDGCVNLSPQILKEADEIEAFMREHNPSVKK